MKKGLSSSCCRFFSALANRKRLAILDALLDRDMSLKELDEELDINYSNLSHHVRILEKCWLVFTEFRGKKKHLKANKETLESLMEVCRSLLEVN
ncbi:MAG: ArsR/SmtB family transcription factor [Candidatus Odinarchaeia archaeon]